VLFVDRIKELREKKYMVQRQFAAALEIDTPMCSKIERDERHAKQHISLMYRQNENQKSVFSLSQFAEKQIFLPYAEELYPDLGNITVHRREFNF
jgi:transcriptional regulator with XRE-family HTH domain